MPIKTNTESRERGGERSYPSPLPKGCVTVAKQINPDDIERHYSAACDLASKIVEQRARTILCEHPELDEFVMAMGEWFFTYKVGAIDRSGIEILEGDSNIVHESEELDFAKPIIDLITEWDNYLKITGEPMRFTAKGPVITEW